MNEQFAQLVDYVKQHLNQGIPEENIRQNLLQHNWNVDLVDRAFQAAKVPQSAHPPILPSETPTLPVSNQSAPDHSLQPNIDISNPKKYKVFRAVGDTFKSIRNNTATFLFTVIVSYIVATVSLILVSLIISKFLYGESGMLFASTPKLLTVLIGSLVLYTAWYAFAGAFILATTSLAINDGSENRKNTLSATLSNGISKMVRVVLADILFILVAFWPVVLIIFVPIILLTSGGAGSKNLLILLPILMLVAIIWIYLALIRFALAPFVALFEPDVPITKTLGRSNHLLQKGGQWFLLKGFLLVILILIILAVATGQSLPELMDSNGAISNVFFIFITVIANGALVMLYRNRKSVRG